MKLFITGGTGFIGSHFVNNVHAAGHELFCLRRQGSKPRIKLFKEPNWVEGSMEDNCIDALRRCDVFVHLASHSTNVPYDTLENCLYWNLTVPLQLLKQAKESGVEKFVIAGTGFEYGLSGERYKYIPVDAPLEPTMTYPASKAAASIVFAQWAIENHLKLQYLRIFQVFGEGEVESRLWPSLHRAALAGDDFNLTLGKQVRAFTRVEKVAEQLVEALDFSKVKKGVPLFAHISAGQPQTVRSFSKKWWKAWKAQGKLYFGINEYRKNEVIRFVPLIRKIVSKQSEVLGNSPKYWSYREAWKRIRNSYIGEHYLETITLQESILSDLLLSVCIRQNIVECKQENNVWIYRLSYKQNGKWVKYIPFSTLIRLNKKNIISVNHNKTKTGNISLIISKPSILYKGSKFKTNNLVENINRWRKIRNIILHGLVKSHPGTATQNVTDFLLLSKNSATEGIWLCRAVEKYSRMVKPYAITHK